VTAVCVLRSTAFLVVFAIAGCSYDPAVPDRVVACTVPADCPTAGDRCVPLPDHQPPRSVCCHDCAPPDASVPDAARSPDVPGPACPQSRGGPPLVQMGEVCIDATEVTNAQYAVFWTAKAAGRDIAGQPLFCAWNDTFTPDHAGAPWPFRAGTESRPVVNVDWCDAFAFCKWAGKRLCGGLSGVALTSWADAGDGSRSQWGYACTGGGARKFPYGAAYDARVCNTGKPLESVSTVEDVGSHPGCRTEAGVFDLSGNVEEWVDDCATSAGPTDLCAIVGQSSFQDPNGDPDFSCLGSAYTDARNVAYELRGFRCCAP
jgi:sulfatase modifying factor 1